MKTVIKVENLTKSYGTVKAVKGISFEVQEGSLFAFLGPNGAGKSTTIDILCTLNKYDSGTISINGLDIDKDVDKIKKNIGVVFQNHLLDDDLTVRENLIIRASFYYKTKKEITNAVNTASDYTETKEFLDRKYGDLSGGQKRRADIARALLNTPKILFLDEPTTGLDAQTRKKIWETIENLQKEKGITIFLTTHYIEEAENADYIVIIDNGLISAEGTAYDLKSKYTSSHIKIKYLNKYKLNIIKYLTYHNYTYNLIGEYLDITIPNTLKAIDILNDLKEYLLIFEVVCGTMEDVFLNITGKEIR